MRYFFLILIFISLSVSSFAQNKRAIFEEAKAFFAAEHYEHALNTFLSSKALSNTDEESRFLMAICYFQLNKLEKSSDLLFEIVREEKSPYPECWWYLGKVFHAKHQFDEAVRYYKLYLRTLRPEHPNRAMVIEEIRRCDNGLRFFYQETKIVAENMGSSINSQEDEFAPVLSPNFSSRLYFSAIRTGNSGGQRNQNTNPDPKYGHFYADMYSSELQGGQWQQATAMDYLLNSPQHEKLIGFSNFGQVLLFYQGWDWDKGIIFADTFRQADQRTLSTTALAAPIDSRRGENELHIYNDTLLIFASRKRGGYGGLDLYTTSFKNGNWTTPVNMGPQINSAFDETSPFLARNGKMLYFSTNNSALSMGGMDVVRSVYLSEAERWSTPDNLGTPINSSSDDTHFSLARDGFTGFFSSSRKDGLGQRDIYIAYFPNYRQEMDPPYTPNPVSVSPPVVAPTRPTPTPVSTPTPTPVRIVKKQWFIESATAQALNTASNYVPLWQNTVAVLQQNQGARTIITYYVPPKNGQLSSEALFEAATQAKALIDPILLRGIAEDRIFIRTLMHQQTNFSMAVSFSDLNRTDNTIPIIGRNNQQIASHATNKLLLYKIQIVSVQKSYRNPDLDNLENVMVEHVPDFPFFRYTIGAFETFREAQNFKNSLSSSRFKGAFIIPYINGERMDKIRARAAAAAYPDLNNYLNR